MQHKGCELKEIDEMAREERGRLRALLARVEAQAAAVEACVAANQQARQGLEKRGAQVTPPFHLCNNTSASLLYLSPVYLNSLVMFFVSSLSLSRLNFRLSLLPPPCACR